jgi:hypothetical protein
MMGEGSEVSIAESSYRIAKSGFAETEDFDGHVTGESLKKSFCDDEADDVREGASWSSRSDSSLLDMRM